MSGAAPTRFRGQGGTTLIADEHGPPTGPPVLLLHGGGQSRDSWRRVTPALTSAGWRTIALDLRGHGDSDWPTNGDYEISNLTKDITCVIDQIGQPPVLIGASLGGIIGLTAQSTTEDQLYRAVVLVDVAPRLEPEGVERVVRFMLANPDGFATLDDAAEAVAAYLPHRRRPTNIDGLRQNLTQTTAGRWVWRWDPAFLTSKPEFTSNDPAALRQRTEDIRLVLTSAVQRLTVPILLVRGAMSDVVSTDGAKDLLRLVPHAQWVDVADAAHMVAGDRNDIFTEALESFLNPMLGDDEANA